MFTEILENVSFVFIWNTISWLSYLILNTCETYISDPLIRAYVQSASMIYIYSFILMESRIFIFEHLYKDVKYISNRKDEGEIYRLYDKSQFLLWSTLGTGFFYNQTFSFSILSVEDLLKCLLMFLVTDGCFYITHSLMHQKYLFKIFHKLHHSIHKPNVYQHIELFTYIDGLSHIVAHWVGFTMLSQYVEFTNQLWLLTLCQWYIVGQLQHGGKDIPQNQIPGLKIVMKLCGIENSFCLQHDLHHTKFKYNYCMTGIYDKLFGTYITPKDLEKPLNEDNKVK